jgi:hypothetical protein
VTRRHDKSICDHSDVACFDLANVSGNATKLPISVEEGGNIQMTRIDRRATHTIRLADRRRLFQTDGSSPRAAGGFECRRRNEGSAMALRGPARCNMRHGSEGRRRTHSLARRLVGYGSDTRVRRCSGWPHDRRTRPGASPSPAVAEVVADAGTVDPRRRAVRRVPLRRVARMVLLNHAGVVGGLIP